MDISSASTQPELLNIIVIDILVVVGEYDITADVAKNGASVRAYESSSSENSCTDTRDAVPRLGFVYVERFREG
jgi:hypothetical protein